MQQTKRLTAISENAQQDVCLAGKLRGNHTMGIGTNNNQKLTPDKQAVRAQKQWERDGTVNEKYLTHTLGDISKGISAFVPESKQDKSSRSLRGAILAQNHDERLPESVGAGAMPLSFAISGQLES